MTKPVKGPVRSSAVRRRPTTVTTHPKPTRSAEAAQVMKRFPRVLRDAAPPKRHRLGEQRDAVRRLAVRSLRSHAPAVSQIPFSRGCRRRMTTTAFASRTAGTRMAQPASTHARRRRLSDDRGRDDCRDGLRRAEADTFRALNAPSRAHDHDHRRHDEDPAQEHAEHRAASEHPRQAFVAVRPDRSRGPRRPPSRTTRSRTRTAEARRARPRATGCEPAPSLPASASR